ncbi:hypothetical protein JCM10449v2_002769 [Rhodotorula kratochvilovae]
MAGSGEKADRRPIDPPPIIRLRMRRPSARKKPAHLLTDADLSTPTLTHTLFMFASLVEEDSEEEMFEVHGSKSALVAGSVVSSLFHLRDQSCFVFPDMSVRMEGRWRFKMSLYEVNEEGVEFCTSILTDTFQVYSSKRFPGMGKSTELSKSFAQQGLKLRIRRPGSKADDTPEESAAPTPAPRLAPQKFRTSSRRAPEPSAAPPPAPAGESFAPPPPRRPSAPAAQPAAAGPLTQAQGRRPWTSWDAASHGGGPVQGPPHAQPYPHAQGYAPYPPRAVSYSGPPAHPQAYDEYHHQPGAYAAAAPSLSGPHRSVSASYRHAAHPYAAAVPSPQHQPQSALAHAQSFPHLRAYAHPPPQQQAYAHPLPHPHPHPQQHALSHPPHPHPHQHPHSRPHSARRSPSPTPILAPIRTLPATAPAPARGSPPSALPGPFAAAARRGLSPPSAHERQTHAAESSLRSTDSPAEEARRPSTASGGGGSLAMLLGGERDAKDVEGGDEGVVFH